MYWTWFEWIHRIGAGTNLLLSMVVGLVAVAVAIQLTRRRQCREAAWLLALGWLAGCALALAQLVIDLLLMPVLGYGFAQWFGYAIDVFYLLSFCIMAAGLFMFRLPAGGRS